MSIFCVVDVGFGTCCNGGFGGSGAFVVIFVFFVVLVLSSFDRNSLIVISRLSGIHPSMPVGKRYYLLVD
jgi:hypothetical protein